MFNCNTTVTKEIKIHGRLSLPKENEVQCFEKLDVGR